jgi:formamidopyrimidine-DNA glycosylase
MPELPEVETTRRGLMPHATQHVIVKVMVRNARLRWPVEPLVSSAPCGQTILRLERRGKYLILVCENGSLIVHLGMSGSLRVVPADTPASAHEHLDIILDNHTALRLRDPRRFGAVLWYAGDGQDHPLLAKLGVEPLSEAFDADYLYRLTRCRTTIKSLLMDSHRIAGIGNIYANEALFYAGLHPETSAQHLTPEKASHLVLSIRDTLTRAIAAGGSSLRDFVGSEGKPGYFQQQYAVYGRTGLPCLHCGHPIQHLKQSQRSSFFCQNCQKIQRQTVSFAV